MPTGNLLTRLGFQRLVSGSTLFITNAFDLIGLCVIDFLSLLVVFADWSECLLVINPPF